jgi:hypothetical protein
MAVIRSISVSPEFDNMRKEAHLSWSEAAKIGMSILLSEAGLVEYDNRLNLVRKMKKFQKIAEEANQKLARMGEDIE